MHMVPRCRIHRRQAGCLDRPRRTRSLRARWRRTGASRRRWRSLLLCRCARADVREVLSHSHFSKEYRAFENVIARCAASVTPLPLNIVRFVIRADLLTVAVNAPVRRVHAFTVLEHPRLRLRIDVCSFLVRLRIEMSDLPVWDHGEPHPRKRERAEDSKKKRSQSFHQWPPEISASTGLRNVGTVDVRPNPNSIRPK